MNANAEKCFDKLWLQDSLIKMYNLRWSANDTRIIFRIIEIADVIVKTPVGETEEFTIKCIVKQGTSHGPVL